MDLVGSIDFSLSKEGGWEAFSLIDTTFGDVLEHDQEPITNEQILPDDVFLDTWTLDPYRIILNRRQDATAPLLRGKLVTVYGPDRRKDLEMMTVIDLRTMDRGALRSYRPIDCDDRGSGRREARCF